MEQTQYGLQDYLAILKRRRWPLLLPALVLFAIASLAAWLWPPTYQSSATILIEEPDVPRDLVSSTVTSFADQRLQVITQRVMSTQNLIGVIDRLDLYAEQRALSTGNQIAQAMRNVISLDLVSADVVDPRSGRPTQATIAFTLSFQDRLPSTAQRALSELVSLYLSENLRTRREQAADTTEFLTSEATKLDALVKRLASALADFKQQNSGRLPEQSALNLQLMDRTERELIETKQRVQSLDERKIYLEAELAQISPNDSFSIDGQRVLSPAEQLRARQTALVSLRGIYGPRHPDVVKLSREIEALKIETGGRADPAELELQLDAMQTKLALARERYAPGHPDVIRLQRQISATREALTAARNAPAEISVAAKPDNPAYIQLQAQLEAVKSDRRALAQQQSALAARLTDFEQRILAAPQIERTYAQLERDYESALAGFRDVSAKKKAAELGQALETDRKSERFSLIEPPDLPVRPVKPNRLAILVLGFVFSVAAGVGCAALFERLDQSVYGAAQLTALTGTPPLIVVPYIRNSADSRRTWNRASLTVLGGVIALAAALFLVQQYLVPLDILWSAAVGLFFDNFAGRSGA